MMSDKTPTERIAEVTNPIKQRVGDIKTPINRVADTLKRRYSEDAPAGVFLRPGKPEALRPKKKKKHKKDRHTRTRVAFMRYAYYDIAFRFFVEEVLDADFVALPEATRKTLELGTLNSTDYVCAPFKHILGDYIEALDMGADVLVQLTGPCRLGYYGELQESICKKKVNPDLSVSKGVKNFLVVLKMIEALDSYHDRYLELAGFEKDPGSFKRAQKDFFAEMNTVTGATQMAAVYRHHMRILEDLPIKIPNDPIRVGLIGEFFTGVDPRSNLFIEDKLSSMGVSLARTVNLTNRILRYNEENLRRSVSEYVSFDMGPTSTLSIAAAKHYAEEGFDGIIHLKSSGCTPEIDCMPVLQRLSNDYHIPILYLSYDSQTSDTGLDTRLEAFYDMIAMRKAR